MLIKLLVYIRIPSHWRTERLQKYQLKGTKMGKEKEILWGTARNEFEDTKYQRASSKIL